MTTAQIRTLAQIGFAVLYIGSFVLLTTAFFDARGGTAFLEGLGLRDSLRILFPLIGLYAFTLIFWQVMVATNLRWLTKLWPQIINFHRYQGGAALTLAIVHPLTIMIGFGLATYVERSFVPASQERFLIPAYLGLTILITTVVTASMAWYGARLAWWRKLHTLNYLAFIFFWQHSWFIGTDTRLYPLNIVWIGALILVAVSLIVRYRQFIIARLSKPAKA